MIVFGFCLFGLRDPLTTSGADSAKPVLFTDAKIDVAQLPAEFAGYTIRAVLPWGQDPGENWTGDFRGGLGKGGESSISLPEDELGSYGKILLHDPQAPYWVMKAPVVEEEDPGPLDLFVVGPPGTSKAPQINTVYWVEGEAFYATAVVGFSGGHAGLVQTWRVTVTRAKCGSYAERHEIDPASYGEGSDGSDIPLLLESKPNFEAHRFKGAFFLWRLPAQRSSIATEVERRYFFVDEPPLLVEENKRFFYRIKTRAVSDVIRDYRFSLTPKEISIENRLQVVQLEEESSAAGYVSRPRRARMMLSRLKAELLFRHALHVAPSGVLSIPLLDDLWERIQACRPLVDHRVVVRSMGVWVFKITFVTHDLVRGQRKALLDLELLSYEPGSTLSTSHPPGPPPPGVGIGGRDPEPPFEKGWAWYATTSVSEEEAPKIELRWAFECQPIEALLILLLSRGGGTGGAYDKMLGRPLALPTSWVNTGSTAVDPTAIDARTSELLQLNQILNETITPQFSTEDQVGDFVRDVSLFYLLLFTSLSTGKFTFRRWATSAPEGLTEINPLKRSLDVGEALDPLRAVRLLSGINEGDLSPQFGRMVTLSGARSVEAIAEAVPLRIWKPGNVLSEQALKTEAFSVFFRALFSVLGGAPRMYAVETSLEDQSFNPGDVVQWSDKRLPTPEGLGFETVRFLVVGKDVNFQESTATYRLLRDYFNETSVSLGRVAPCLIIDQVVQRNGDDFTIDIKSIGDPSIQIDAAYDEIFAELANVSGRLRLFCPLEHNPEPTDEEERLGYLEASCTLQSVYISPRARINRLVITVDPSWERGGFTRYDLVRRGALIVFTDRREAVHNPEANLIEPFYLQLEADGSGFDYAKWGDLKTFDRNYTLISDTP